MNSLVEQELPGTQELRDQLLRMISDEDLAYELPGDTLTLGELCEEMGFTQQVYIHSFGTFKQDWQYRASEPEASNSTESLKVWFEKLDAELYEALAILSEGDVHGKQIDRGHGNVVSPYVQFQIYREALLIFYAKASIYLRVLEIPFSGRWESEIG